MDVKGNEDFISRVEDYVAQANAYRKVFTPFLTPLEQSILTSYVGNRVYLEFEGGYDGCEYKRCRLSCECLDIPFPIVCLRAKYQTKFHELQHRDVLGALMNLGIQRNHFGDIIVAEGFIYIFVHREITDFIKQELQRVKQCNVTFEEYQDTITFAVKMKYKKHNIASFRLDVVVAAITHLSREKAKAFIQEGLVKVNYLLLEDCTYICNNGCILSIRGYGRFKLIDKERKTKGNRFCVEIGKYE